jgi:excisionase family DNA binding protein
MAQRYLNTKQAAEYLGIGGDGKAVAVLYQWVHRGKIPYIKVGRLLRFDKQQLDQWMAEHSKGAKVAAAVILAGPILLTMIGGLSC